MCLSRSASDKLLAERAEANRGGMSSLGYRSPHASANDAHRLRAPPSSDNASSCDDGLHDMLQEEDAEACVIERLRWREFALVYLSYMGFLACRKNYGLWLPAVVSELGHSKGKAGMLGSALEFSYGACSFFNGVVVSPLAPSPNGSTRRLLHASLRPRR